MSCTELLDADSGGQNEVGLWGSSFCSLEKPFICKASASPDYDPPGPPPACTYSGYSDFISFGDACYKWESEPMTWEDAQAKCHDQGSNLVSILDRMEEAYLLAGTDENAYPWIGLSNVEVSNLTYLKPRLVRRQQTKQKEPKQNKTRQNKTKQNKNCMADQQVLKVLRQLPLVHLSADFSA